MTSLNLAKFPRPRHLLLALALFTPLAAQALDPASEAPTRTGSGTESGVSGLFWKVEPPADAKEKFAPGYLIGTVHIADSSYYPLAKPIMDALDSTDVLLVELDEAEGDQTENMKLFSSFASLPKGQTIADLYSPSTVKKLEQAVESVGVPADSIRAQKPVYTVVTLSVLQAMREGLSPEYGIDLYLTNQARKRPEIRVKGLETFEGQMKLLDKLPADEKAVLGYLEEFYEAPEMYRDMGEAWKTGNGGALYQAAIAEPMRESPELEPFYKMLFFDRNESMTTGFKQCLSENLRCMLAVGAGHMVGPGGVADLLRKQGFRVNQVK
ncbi:TraB/GumN family protein [Allohahella marinimesophila]|uniref:TraB/GumN family protein n=1 Tax=Allohahella marinimesophila TaxID=1054972 RepID=A0ABP7PSC4_9GAMM